MASASSENQSGDESPHSTGPPHALEGPGGALGRVCTAAFLCERQHTQNRGQESRPGFAGASQTDLSPEPHGFDEALCPGCGKLPGFRCSTIILYCRSLPSRATGSLYGWQDSDRSMPEMGGDMKRRIVQIDSHEEADRQELEYWQQQTPQARLAATEEINRNLWVMKHGTEAGFHRVHRVVSQREG